MRGVGREGERGGELSCPAQTSPNGAASVSCEILQTITRTVTMSVHEKNSSNIISNEMGIAKLITAGTCIVIEKCSLLIGKHWKSSPFKHSAWVL